MGSAVAREIRVLHVTGSWPPLIGGVSDYGAYLHATLASMGGYSGRVITTVLPERAPEMQTDVVSTVPDWGWRSVWRVAREVARREDDVIHFQMPTEPFGKKVAPGFLPLLLRLRGVRRPIVVTVHEYKRRSRLGKLRTMISCIPADRVVTIDDCNRSDFFAPVAAKTDVVIVGPNVPSSVVAAGAAQTKVRAVTFGYFGTVRATKGIETLLRAFAKVRAGAPSLQLLIVGYVHDEFKRDVLDAILTEHDLHGVVEFTDEVPADALDKHLLRVDVGVLPFPDGLSGGRTSFTALAALGIPVITSRPCCATMEGPHGDAVIFPRAEDADGFAEAMTRIAADDGAFAAARKAAAQASPAFTWNAVATAYRRVYERCLREKGGWT